MNKNYKNIYKNMNYLSLDEHTKKHLERFWRQALNYKPETDEERVKREYKEGKISKDDAFLELI